MTKTFKAVDFMGIVGEATITPTGNEVVVLSGPNGAGKTSFRLAIESLIKYGGTRLIPAPIHEGKTESRAEMIDTELDLRLERVWKRAKDGSIKSTFSAYALDGAKHESGVDVVAKAIGAGITDGSLFVAMSEKEQQDKLLEIVALPFDLKELAAKRKSYFDGRTDRTREVKRLTAQLAGYPAADSELPTEEVSAADLIAELKQISEHNTAIAALQRESVDGAAELERIQQRGQALAKELGELKVERERLVEAQAERTAALDMAEPKDAAEVEVKLGSVDEINAKVRKQAERAKVEADLAEQTAAEAALDAKLEAIDLQKAEGLAAASFPFPGLSVDDDGVTVDGRPFISLNEGEQQFVAWKIATSVDPDLKLRFIKNGDALDNDTLARIVADAEERGWTVIADRGRDNSAEFGFVFDEGVLRVSK